VEQVNFLCKPS